MLARDDINGYEDDDSISLDLTALDIYRFHLVIVVFLRTRLLCTCSPLQSIWQNIQNVQSDTDPEPR
jgi:hypothetical protein